MVVHRPGKASAIRTTGGTAVLVLCKANICRSVMTEAIMARRLAVVGVTASVWSAGMLAEHEPPPPEVISVMASHGADVSCHRSRVLSPSDLDRADLVLAMERAQVRHAAVTSPHAWPRTFTIKELIRRGEQIGPRPAEEGLAEWIARAHAGRTRSDLLGDCREDDIADPYGGSIRAYAKTARLLDHLVARLVTLCWGVPGTHV